MRQVCNMAELFKKGLARFCKCQKEVVHLHVGLRTNCSNAEGEI
jgi:hypothetical protein